MASRNGVQDWASLTEAHSEIGVQKVVKKHKTQLAVPITTLLAAGSEIPWIAPRDWFHFIMDCGLWHMFAGLTVEQKHLEQQTWKKFWKDYQVLHPDFALFSEEWSHVDLCRCVGEHGCCHLCLAGYKDYPAEELNDLLDYGLQHPDTKERYWVVCLGVKGDWPYLSKAGHFTRAFNTMPKQGSSEKEHGCCHLCLAL